MNVKVSELPVSGALVAADEFPVVSGGTTKKGTPGDLPVSTAQQTALDLKADQAALTVTDQNVTAINARTAGISSETTPIRIGLATVMRYEVPPAYAHDDDLASVSKVKDLIRQFNTKIEQAVAGANPTKAECALAFKQLPHYSFSSDDNFVLKDTTGASKYWSVSYFANGDTAESGANYVFIYTKLTVAT